MAEEALADDPQVYIWRLRLPFDEVDDRRNLIGKLLQYPRLYFNVNSISHRRDFVRACLELWNRRSPFGIYNITNPGFVNTRQIVEMIQKILRPKRSFDFWASDQEFYASAALAPRSNCVLDVSKLLCAGVKMRPVEEALTHALEGKIKSE
jgi:hypothetical protein